MCKLKSCIVLKDRVYCPDHDSHDRMLDELGIKDTQRNAETRFVRVELSPVDGDIFSPVDEWELDVDQDFIPDWFAKELDKPRVVDAVKKWAESHIFVGKNNFKLTAGGTYYLKNCKEVTAWENSQVTAWGNSQVNAWGNSVGVIESYPFSASRESFVLMENSTLKDCKTKTIYQSGGWKVVEVGKDGDGNG